MARDGNVKLPNQAAPIDQEEQFWNSEEGQDIKKLFDDFQSGRKSYDQAFDEYNGKWADKPLPSGARMAPNAPTVKVPKR
jgi:hypothetical protein